MTTATIKALRILKVNPGIRPREFARLMWPNNPNWSNHTRCGHGTSHGGGMNLAGGAFLGKLARRGLIMGYGHTLTDAGRALLAANPEKAVLP